MVDKTRALAYLSRIVAKDTNDWTLIAGAVISAPSFAWNPTTNAMQMVVLGGDNSIWMATFNSTGAFKEDWTHMPGGTIDLPAIAWNPVKGHFLIVVKGIDNSICSLERGVFIDRSINTS